MKKFALTIAAVVLSTLQFPDPLDAAPRYVYHAVETLPDATSTKAHDINKAGRIVGSVSTEDSHWGFLKDPGKPMQPLIGLSTPLSSADACGINERGQVVGMMTDGENHFRAYLKNPGQPMKELGTLDGAMISWAYGVNNSGQVVGLSISNEFQVKAFLKDPGRPMQDLGIVGRARSINDAGQVVGCSEVTVDSSWFPEMRAFLRNPNGETSDLGSLGGEQSCAYRINNAGQVVGWAENGQGNYRAFLKTPGQPMQDLGILADSGDDSDSFVGSLLYMSGGGSHSGTLTGNFSPPIMSTTENVAYDINNAGQVAGTSYGKAFLWESGTMYDLNDLVVNLPPGLQCVAAYGINDKGWIVGENSQGEAFFLRPFAPLPLDLLLGD